MGIFVFIDVFKKIFDCFALCHGTMRFLSLERKLWLRLPLVPCYECSILEIPHTLT